MQESKDIRTISSNISLLRRRVGVTEEQIDISLMQLASLIADRQDGTLEEAYRDFCVSALFPTLRERVVFCRYMASDKRFASRIADYDLFGEGDVPLAGTHGRVAFMHGGRADSAYAQFSKSRRGIKAYHVASFSEGCEAVASNLAEFCILPIENSTDGKLYTFYSMLGRYSLRICAAVLVSDADGANETVFAFAGRKVDALVPKNAKRRFEFSVIHENAELVSEITQAVSVLGGTLCDVASQTLDYDGVGRKYYFAADFDTLSPLALGLFVSLEYPRYETVGVYSVK